MSTALSLTNIANNAKKQYLATLKTAKNVVSARRKGKITQANARNRGQNFMTANALNQLRRVSNNIEALNPNRAAKVLLKLNSYKAPTRRRRLNRNRKKTRRRR